MEVQRSPNQGAILENFKKLSIDILATQLGKMAYKGYPNLDNRLYGEPDSTEVMEALSRTEGPEFAKPYKQLALPTDGEIQKFGRTDQLGRPLHPWFNEMVADPRVGVTLGNGFYWHYGANKTADGIPVRYDLNEPHILLITRQDTGQPALVGGHVDEGETPLQAAYRENNEEVDKNIFDIYDTDHAVRPVYEGPLADLRATAHAWPHTHAFALDIKGKVDTPMSWDIQNAEIGRAFWQPASRIGELFGSHRLLAKMALTNSL